jgi:hypothetical protein
MNRLGSAAAARESYPLQFVYRALVDDVAGIEGGGRLEEHDRTLLVSHGPVFDSPWHNDKLALVQLDRLVTELHPELSLNYQEHLVFVLMAVPDELALKLDQLDQLSIEFAGDVWLPRFVNSGEFVGKVHSSRHTP